MLVFLAACHHAPTPRLPEPTPAWVGQTNAGGELAPVVARLNGVDISREELEGSDPAITEAASELVTARYDGLAGLVADRLVTAAATAAGTDPQTWFEGEITKRITPVTDEEITTFYADHSREVGGMTLEEAREPIRAHLTKEREAKAAWQAVRELKKAAQLEILLPPRLRVAVDAADGARIGSPDAPVQIVEFSDFQCPYCQQAADIVHEVAAAYPTEVSVVFRHYPLPFHPNAHRAAEAAECAREQGKFWEYHDQLFAHQPELGGEGVPDLTLSRFAEELGLKGDDFRTCLESGRHAALVDLDLSVGEKVGTTGTPSFYVNGIPMGGAQPFEVFADLVDEELLGRK